MKTTENHKNTITRIAVVGMLSAVAFVLQYIEVSIPFVPSFLKLDFSDIPELVGAFALGPAEGVLIALIKNVLHLPFGSSSGAGELANFLLGAAFAYTAGMIYQQKKTKKRALLSSLTGTLAMALVSFPLNLYVIYPIYAKLWVGGDMNVIIQMYRSLLPASDTLAKSLLIFNIPFTLVKGLLVVFITMLIYKPLSRLFTRLDSVIQKKKS